MSLTVLIALAVGLVAGLLLARTLGGGDAGEDSGEAPAAATAASAPPPGDPPEVTPLPDVSEILRKMLAATGRRAMVPVILRVIEQLFEPEQAVMFVTRPDGKLALADGKGLPDALPRGLEAEPRPDDAAPDLPGLRAGLSAPIRADGRLLGLVCVGGRRRRHPEDARLLRMVADLSAVAIVQGERLRTAQETANTDGLTGVFTKRHFQERLTVELSRAESEKGGLGMLLLDIDHFKNYNDTNGHPAGDEVLRRIGQILRSSIREDDVVARYGGEEFVILYPGASKALAYRLAQGLRQTVESYPFAEGARQPMGRVTISGGVAAFPADARTDFELVRAADEALYEAKAAGRNRIVGVGGFEPT